MAQWKDEEERQLWGLGVDEDAIQRLHTYDWRRFKAERNFYEWQTAMSEALEWTPQIESHELRNANDLLNNIESEKLLLALKKVDKLTLEMLVMRMSGYSTEQICKKLKYQQALITTASSESEKIQNFFESD